MVDYATFTAFSNLSVSEADFAKIEARASLILSLLCKDKWDPQDTTCIQAVCHQVEHIIQNGGLVAWDKTEGVVTSRSYTVGGESESIAMRYSKGIQSTQYFMGLSISPFAWALLNNGGFLQTVKGIRVW